MILGILSSQVQVLGLFVHGLLQHVRVCCLQLLSGINVGVCVERHVFVYLETLLHLTICECAQKYLYDGGSVFGATCCVQTACLYSHAASTCISITIRKSGLTQRCVLTA